MSDADLTPLSAEELAAEGATALPDKEVISLLDLNADLNLGLDVAAPIDLAVAANANVAAPIDASVGANVLSVGSDAQALAQQGTLIDQGITGDATASGTQDSVLHQAPAPADSPATPAPVPAGGTPAPAVGADGNLLNVNVNLASDLKLAAPITGAVAANANVAAPIDASVAANVGSIDSSATAIAHQDAIIHQDIHGNSTATTDQTSNIQQ
ncbi:MAG: peptidoglycan-binding protein [Actinomycetota bacterium]|nr:peptidoglycan-binding protein [Actinomycetota bacterium]